MNSSLRKPAETAVEQCMNLQADESCAVVTDDKRKAIGEAIYRVAADITDDTAFLRYPPGDQHGEEPPEPVAAAMAAADVVLAPTTKSLSHTEARSEANAAGARVATLPGITEAVFLMGLDADYDAIAGHCRDVLAQVEGADEIRVTSPQGTDITFDVTGREWKLDTGIVHEPGEMSNLPAGEVFLSPASADGTFVVDGTMMPHGELEGELLRFEVADGQVTEIGDDVLVGTKSVIDGRSELGSRVSMQTGVYVPTHTTIGDDVFLGPHAVLTNDPYPLRTDEEIVGPTIEDGVSVGANATILPDVTVGERSFVAAGAVVTEDVPSDCLAVGAPASVQELPPELQGGNSR